MQPVAAAADVCEDERDVWMPFRECAELHRVRCLLARPIPPAVLPHVLQYGDVPLAGEHANRIEQRIVRPPARGQLDADHSRVETAHDFRARVRRIVRIDADVATDRIGMLALQRKERVVSCCDIAR